jgi:hypothetical protein
MNAQKHVYLMLRISPEVIAQKQVKINTNKKTAEVNAQKHVKANAKI